MSAGGLLEDVERIVVEGHRSTHDPAGGAWSAPLAYRWLHYEDPMPVRRLAEGVKRLRRGGAEFDQGAVEKACAKASQIGFLN